MTYETFKHVIVDRLHRDIPDPKTISLQKVYKNNGVQLDGLLIMENGCNISPTIYLNYCYAQYEAGKTFQDVYQYILELYRENKPKESIDAGFFTDFDHIRERIVYKLIHYEKNLELLADIPFVRFLDLAIVFYCFIPMNGEAGSGSILIHNHHLNYWNINKEELFRLARENTVRMLPPKLMSMHQTILQMTAGLDPEEYSHLMQDGSDDTLMQMYVLTNEEKLFGAICILYQDLLKSYAEDMNSDFYILPSSVHEVILIPSGERKDDGSLSDIVRSVNEIAVSVEEILSDHIYYYSRKENRITS